MQALKKAYDKRHGDHCFGGYHIEDWCRGFDRLIFFFLDRRRGRMVLDGKNGPTEAESLDPYVFSPSRSAPLPTSDILLQSGDRFAQ